MIAKCLMKRGGEWKMTERWSKWFATGVSSKEAKSMKKKKKIIGEETRLIKVVFKEADMLADWIEITRHKPRQQSALTKDFNNLILSNYDHFCQDIILTFCACTHPAAEDLVCWRLPTKRMLQLFNSQDVERMLTNDKHGLQSFLRPPHCTHQLPPPPPSSTTHPPKSCILHLNERRETRREVKAWRSFRGSQMNDWTQHPGAGMLGAFQEVGASRAGRVKAEAAD